MILTKACEEDVLRTLPVTQVASTSVEEQVVQPMVQETLQTACDKEGHILVDRPRRPHPVYTYLSKAADQEDVIPSADVREVIGLAIASSPVLTIQLEEDRKKIEKLKRERFTPSI